MSIRNSIVNIMSSFISDKEARNKFSGRYKRKSVSISQYKEYQHLLSEKEHIAAERQQLSRERERYDVIRNVGPWYEYLKDYYFSSPSEKKDTVSFKHSGQIGDIIYSLPALAALTDKYSNTAAHLYLDLTSRFQRIGFSLTKNTLLNQKLFDVIEPLLAIQPYISSVTVYKNEDIDFDLDLFRHKILFLSCGDITKWYQYLFPVSYDTSKPWITVDKTDNVADSAIVIAKSPRMSNPLIDWSFLVKYPKVYFVGINEEYEAIKEIIPKIEWIKTKDYLELARVISGAKLFIGNQSSPFSVAEGLKVPRLLCLPVQTPVATPAGNSCAVFCVQSCFESLVKDFWENK